jgi:hypothetical protein
VTAGWWVKRRKKVEEIPIEEYHVGGHMSGVGHGKAPPFKIHFISETNKFITIQPLSKVAPSIS